MCAFNISERPPPEPRTRPTTLLERSELLVHGLDPVLLQPARDETTDLGLAGAARHEGRVHGVDRDQLLEQVRTAATLRA